MVEPLRWQIGTVTAIQPQTPRVSSFTLALPDWRPHRPGQHYDVRLTAADGYQAQRSYSIASAADRAGEVELGVERIADGEVSPYFHEVLVEGDQVELRGPIGGYFVWEPGMGGPLLLVGGGSGVVPLMAMLRARRAAADPTPAALLYSSRQIDDVIYREELQRLASEPNGPAVFHTLTREQPSGWDGFARRIDGPMLTEVLDRLGGIGSGPSAYICGPTLLVENAAAALTDLGLAPALIRTERFGPTT
ncbi:MAG TPA: FAD-binding oxidoreductase [Candidatus Limnocylindria bacterium]|nr:FAD-binding oxidoreductase [Candidatus Limnocylindria bacterium]